MYKIAILLAIGAGFISILQTGQLRDQLRLERDYLAYSEAQATLVQRESLKRSYESGYKRSLIDSHLNQNSYIITEDPTTKEITLWKKESTALKNPYAQTTELKNQVNEVNN